MPETSAFVTLSMNGATGCPASNVHRAVIAFVEEKTSHGFLQPLRLQENAEYEVAITAQLTPSGENVLREQADNPQYPFVNGRLAGCLHLVGHRSATALSDGRFCLRRRLHFDNRVGRIDLTVSPEFGSIQLLAEVVSTKLDYENDFHRLLADLADIHAETLLSLDAPTEAALIEQDGTPSSQMLLLHLRWLFQQDNLPLAIATVLGNPLRRQRSRTMIESAAFVTSPDYLELQSSPERFDWQRGGVLANSFRGLTPHTLPSLAKEDRIDLPENRFVLYCLRQIRQLVAGIRLPKKYASSKNEVARWNEWLTDVLSHPIWKGVSECRTISASMVMVQRRGYREVLQFINVLSRALTLNTSIGELDPESGDLREIWELYELWCYFELRNALADVTGDSGTPSVHELLKSKNYAVNLKSGAATCCTFKHTLNSRAIEIQLYYTMGIKVLVEDSGWNGSYSTRYNPDFSICMNCDGHKHWLHFDAKYRVTFVRRNTIPELADSVAENGPHEDDAVRWFRSEDIDTMHKYRDAILGSRGCYVLYPGDTSVEAVYVRHPDSAYRSQYVIPSVGAFPLCPSADSTLAKQRIALRNHLRVVLANIAAADNYREEQGIGVASG